MHITASKNPTQCARFSRILSTECRILQWASGDGYQWCI